MSSFQLDVDNSTQWDQFLISLNETIEWVTNTVDQSKSSYGLRSPRLAPDPLAGSRSKVVSSVQYNRFAELWTQKLRTGSSAQSLQGGKLLAFQPDGSLSDGAAEQETNGFFAGDNTPAWDTWVGWFQDTHGAKYGYLVCWIPPLLIDNITDGIDFNPEQCIWWIDDVENALAAKLRREQIL